jgi:hypothetical protein
MSFGIPVRNGLGLGLLASTSLATGNVGYSPGPIRISWGSPDYLVWGATNYLTWG